MLANELIDRLERLGLLDQEIIEALRQQLAEGGARVTPEAVAKLLVDNGQLTHFQASKLIGELRSGDYSDAQETGGIVDLGFAEDEQETVEEADVFSVEPIAEVASPDPVAQSVPVNAMESAPDSERPTPARPKPEPPKSVWDSFKIYGYVGIIALLLLVGGGIYWVLSREGADEVIGNANKLYDQQNYEAAQKAYQGFSEDYPDSNTVR